MPESHRVRRTGLISVLVVPSILLATGCLKDRDGSQSLPVRSSSAVEEEVSSLSSQVLDMVKVKGKATEPGPYSSSCTDDGKKEV